MRPVRQIIINHLNRPSMLGFQHMERVFNQPRKAAPGTGTLEYAYDCYWLLAERVTDYGKRRLITNGAVFVLSITDY